MIAAVAVRQRKMRMISATETLVPILEPFIRYARRRHLMASLYRHRALAESASSGEQIMVVGFADLVGFTAASQALDESELAAVVDRFAALAYEHIPAHGGRVVKMIGDEVMFAAESSFNAAEIARRSSRRSATTNPSPTCGWC